MIGYRETFIQIYLPIFDGFSPQLMPIEEFLGVVAAKDALIKSLNIPAVLMAQWLWLVFSSTVSLRAGVSGLFRSADDYGLPLIWAGRK